MPFDSPAVHEFADSMAHIAWMAAADGSVVWFNRRFYEYTGLPEGAAVGWDWSVVIHADDLQPLVQAVVHATKTGHDLRVEARARRHDGEYRWMLIQAVALEKNGERFWYGTATDIDARIQSEQDRQQSEQRLRAIIEGAEEFAVILMDPDLKITEWNVGAENIFGWSRNEAIGQEGSMIFVDEDKHSGAFLKERETALECGRAADERWHQRKDGSRLWGSGVMTVICNDDKSVRGFIKILRDVTERKLMEQELEQRVKARTAELQAANEEMQAFTYSVSHDLRAPLRAIVSTSRILLEEADDKLSSEEARLLERQAENANRMATLIDDLLRLSRLARQAMAIQEVDISEMARLLVVEMGIDHTRMQIQDGMRAEGDPTLIWMALENLVGNAYKFSPDGGKIWIGQEDSGAFFVRDQGIGFDMAYVGKLFLPFERLQIDERFPGTGIGLANVKRIVERHNGRVWAESQGPGMGATFYFTLPRA